MNKCNFCNVFIKDDTDHCPLCGGVIEKNEPGVSTYPNVLKKEKAISFIFRLMIFIAIVAIVTCININYTMGIPIRWSLIVTFSLLYVLLVLYMFVKENAGYRVRMYGIAAAGCILLIAIDYICGFKRWSVNFVLPSIIIFLDVSLLLLMLINRRNWQSYILLLTAMVPVSLIPVLFYKLGIITNPYLSRIAFGLSLFASLGVIILGGPRAKCELYRRFHIKG